MPEPFERTFTLAAGEGLSDAVVRGLQEQSYRFGDGELCVRLSRPTRSDRQNRYLFGFIYPTIRRHLIDLGLDAPDKWALHLHFCTLYLEPQVKHAFGRVYRERGESKRLDTTAFHYLIESIKYDEEVVMPLCIDWEAEERRSGADYDRPKPKPKPELPALADFAGAELHDEPLTMDQISNLF